MFTWICPKCGGEVPPAYAECPRCVPQKREGQEHAVRSEPTLAPLQREEPVRVPQRPVAAPVQETPVQAPPPSAPVTTTTPALSPALVAIGAALGMVALLAMLYLYVLPRSGNASEKRDAALPAQPRIAPQASHPLTKHIEVGGVRIQGEKTGKAKVSFLVINHSGVDLPELTMDVHIGSAGRDYFHFPAALPSLGPWESREMSVTTKTDLKLYELPDWQLVQPRFTISSSAN